MGQFVSPAAIKFTVVWFLMSVFFLSMEKIESTDATEGTGEEFPVNGTPVVETPSVVTGTPFDFAPLWKLIPLPPSAPSLHISQPCYDRPAFWLRMGLYLEAGQPDVCPSRGFFPLSSSCLNFLQGHIEARKQTNKQKKDPWPSEEQIYFICSHLN